MKEGFAGFVGQPGIDTPPALAGTGRFSGFMNDAAGTYQVLKMNDKGQRNFTGGTENVVFEYSNDENPENNIKITTTKPISAATKLRFGIGALGSVAGILVAVHRKSGFWGGLGWWIVGGMAGGAIGWIVTSGMNEEK